jgi:DNA-directed RNA polymerase specialized sigma54-like protein
MKIKIEINDKTAIMTIDTVTQSFEEKIEIVECGKTRVIGKSLVEQLQEDGFVNEDFIEEFETATDDFMLHDLLCLVNNWFD